MDKILAKLKEANVSEEDIQTLKSEFDGAVKSRVDEQTADIKRKSEDWCALKIDSATKMIHEQYSKLAAEYCKKKAVTIAKKADKKIAEHFDKLDKMTKQYIAENLEELFHEKYDEEIKLFEESVIQDVDTYLSYFVNENIGTDLINKTAINETLVPVVKGIQNLFEQQFVPLNVSGTKKLKEAERTIAKLQKKLDEQLDANIRLSEQAQKAAKQALIAEKTAGLSDENKEQVKHIFENKSYSTTQEDIDAFIKVITEHDENDLPISNAAVLHEQAKKTLRKVPSIEDGTKDYVTEKFQPNKATSIESQEELLFKQAGQFLTEV